MIALGDARHTRPDGVHHTRALVPGHTGHGMCGRAVGDVVVTVTDARCRQLDPDFARSGPCQVQFFDVKMGVRFQQEGGFDLHRFSFANRITMISLTELRDAVDDFFILL